MFSVFHRRYQSKLSKSSDICWLEAGRSEECEHPRMVKADVAEIVERSPRDELRAGDAPAVRHDGAIYKLMAMR